MALINPTRVLFSPRAPMRARVNIANNNAQRPSSGQRAPYPAVAAAS
jgi:hypothetical protein